MEIIFAKKWQNGIIFAFLALIAVNVRADSIDVQRDRYQQLNQAWDKNQMETVAQLMPSLRDYPLYPYLEYRQLVQNLEHESPQTISRFIQQYPHLSVTKELYSHFINELARRQNWHDLLSFSTTLPKTTEARCNWYYAKWVTGDQQGAYAGAKKLWLVDSALSPLCDNLFSVLQDAGTLSELAILERIHLSMKAGNTRLVDLLAKQLSPHYQTLFKALLDLQKNPHNVKSFAHNFEPTNFTRQITLLTFARAVRQDVEHARAMILSLVRWQKLNEQEKQQLNELVAWQLINNHVTADQARWRDTVVMRSHSVALIEHRIRLALSHDDHHGLNTWLALLPPEAKQKDEWQYWQADRLFYLGNKEQAHDILQKLIKKSGFYPMVAAQRLGIAYSISVDKASRVETPIPHNVTMARVRELMYWHMGNLALNEWAYLLNNKEPAQQLILARYALKQGWWALGVRATISGKLWNHLEERFPLAWYEAFKKETQNKNIPQSFAMAIARRESAWNPEAQSPVGALGLMQVMPATAAHTVKMYHIPNYTNSSQLFNPEMNIQIGTGYLSYVYQKFGQNRAFAAAAYNTGPSRVKNWLNKRTGKWDLIAFIESIPFLETRQYVKNVLAYDVYYRYFMGQPSYNIIAESEWQRHD